MEFTQEYQRDERIKEMAAAICLGMYAYEKLAPEFKNKPDEKLSVGGVHSIPSIEHIINTINTAHDPTL